MEHIKKQGVKIELPYIFTLAVLLLYFGCFMIAMELKDLNGKVGEILKQRDAVVVIEPVENTSPYAPLHGSSRNPNR